MMHYQHPYRKRQDKKVCEKQSCEAYLALVQQHKVSLRPGTMAYVDIRKPHVCIVLISGFEHIFPCSGLDTDCFVLLKVYVSYGTRPTPRLYLFLLREKGLLWLKHKKDACSTISPHQLQDGSHWPWGPMLIINADLLRLLCVFHLVTM